MKKVTKVKTVIDGLTYTFTGQLTKNGKILKCSKGMILTIKPGDIVTTEEIEIKKKSLKQIINNPFLELGNFINFKK